MSKTIKELVGRLLGLPFAFSPNSEINCANIPDTWQPFPGHEDVASWRRADVCTDKLTACFFRSEVDNLPAHYHDCTQITIVLEGHVIFSTPDGAKRLYEGESIVVPPKVPHTISFKAPSLLLIIWHPAFKDGNYTGVFERPPGDSPIAPGRSTWA